MKKVLFYALAGLLIFTACSKNNASGDTQKPSINWEANSSFAVMEISQTMDAKVTVKIPEKATSFKITLATIPVELIGVANRLIGTQGNKASATTAGVLDLIEDNTTVQTMSRIAFSTAVGETLKTLPAVTLDFAKLLEELAGDTPLANQSAFTFRVTVVDSTGAKLEKDIRFNWTSAPEITCSTNFPYLLSTGTTTPLVLNIDAKGKIAGITLQFDGDAEQGILSWIQNRNKTVNDGSAVIDLMKEGTGAAFNLPEPGDVKDKTQLSLNLTKLMTNFSFEAKTPGDYSFLVTVVDALGKNSAFPFVFQVPEPK